MPELEIINKLYLELSQVATAETANERRLNAGIVKAHEAALALCHQIEKIGASPEQTNASVMASQLRAMLQELS